ncbi:MAG: translation elongation factor Ts [Planctomycetota bacterium]|nr:translation elongation factor Ts [Planctomycetota bacterium]MDI6786966.1 translation elongation factor Ts [Planctomycetota bacterium]
MSVIVSVKEVKELRDKTSASILECKKSLEEAGGDINKAADLLRRRGLAIAEKKMGKAVSQGRIGSYIHSNGKVGVLVELACETDFVANNEEFQTLLKDLCLHITAMSPLVVSRDQLDKALIEQEKEFYRKEVKDKPPQIVEKIAEGKIEKFFYIQKCLLDQFFVKDDKVKVADHIKGYIAKLGENIVVKRFQRFEIGK